MFEFDLQMFADEATEDNGAVEDTSAEVSQDGAESVEEEEKEPIPEELDGLPEDAAREVMAEATKMEQGEEESEPEQAAPDDSQIVKSGTIPYPRFKEKVDESNALKAQLEAYRQRYGDLGAAQQEQPIMMKPAATQRVQPPQMPQLNLTPDLVKQIDELKKQEALRMSGLSQEDLDGMEYMEEDDPRKTQYQFALKMAENTVMSRIQQAQIEQMRQAEAVLRAHDASVQEYNQFAQKEMSEPDFQNVMQFATQDFFFGRSPIEQQTLSEAYYRIERNVASPTDVMLIKNYFTEAKNAFRGGNSATKSKNPMSKVKQAGTFPRSQQVQGSSDNDTGVSVATLEKMLEEKSWDEIPDKYKKMLMGV